MSPPTKPIVNDHDARRAVRRLLGPEALIMLRSDWLTGHKTIMAVSVDGTRYFGHATKWPECYERLREKALGELEYERDDIRASDGAPSA